MRIVPAFLVFIYFAICFPKFLMQSSDSLPALQSVDFNACYDPVFAIRPILHFHLAHICIQFFVCSIYFFYSLLIFTSS
jgi:hypothetical protein